MKVEPLLYGDRKVFTVASFNRGVAEWLQRLPTLWIEGEITELRRSDRWGSVFFTLKDPADGACLPASIPRRTFDALKLPRRPLNLQWLFTGTLIGMLAVDPPFAALVARLPRVKFIAISYRFFAANLLLFAVALHWATAEQDIWIGRAFFIWASVFNLFVVSVFWAMMVDVFDADQGKRLFGVIAAAATLGGIFGSSVTAALAKPVSPVYLLLVSALLLELAVFCVRRLSRLSEALNQRPTAADGEAPIGGSMLAGLAHAFNSAFT